MTATYDTHYVVHTHRFGLEPRLFVIAADAKKYAESLRTHAAYSDQSIYVSLLLFDITDAHIVTRRCSMMSVSHPDVVEPVDSL